MVNVWAWFCVFPLLSQLSSMIYLDGLFLLGKFYMRGEGHMADSHHDVPPPRPLPPVYLFSLTLFFCVFSQGPSVMHAIGTFLGVT